MLCGAALVSGWAVHLHPGSGSPQAGNNLCGALAYGCARRWLKALGWDLVSSFCAKCCSSLPVCWICVLRPFLMVTWSFLMPNQPNSVSSEVAVPTEAPSEASLIHQVELEVHPGALACGGMSLQAGFLERSLTQWDPALAETTALSLVSCAWSSVSGRRRSDKMSWQCVAFGCMLPDPINTSKWQEAGLVPGESCVVSPTLLPLWTLPSGAHCCCLQVEVSLGHGLHLPHFPASPRLTT